MPTKISCREAGFDCAFELQSEDETEVIEFTRQHAESSHDMDLSRADVAELLQTV